MAGRSVCMAVAMAIACLPLSHHFSGFLPADSLATMASLLDAAAPDVPTIPVPAFLRSVSMFNPAGLHVEDAGLELQATGTGLHRLVRTSRDAGTFYFEGWYVKMTAARSASSIAIIPGILLSDAEEYAFIMIANRNDKQPTMHKFPLADVLVKSLRSKDEDFYIQIGNNKFATDSVQVDIPGVMQGSVSMQDPEPLPSSVFLPSIMGWFAYIPGMQCNHGVLSLSHRLSGTLSTSNGTIELTGGIGYTEKDWGWQFPRKWIWMQSNMFENSPGSCFLFSIASIPFPNERVTLFEFTGFLGFLKIGQTGELYRFATYTGASLQIGETSQAGDGAPTSFATFRAESAQHILTVIANGNRTDEVKLWGPRNGVMVPLVDEGLNARITILLTRRSDGTVIFQDTGVSGGMEVEWARVPGTQN